MGRPPKFTDTVTLQEAIDKFFTDCDVSGKPYTITGLAYELDTTRETLCDYEKKPDFSDTIKRAKLRVERYAEEKLYTGTPTGPIFALKNFGWSDKQDINLGGQKDNPVQTETKMTADESYRLFLNAKA